MHPSPDAREIETKLTRVVEYLNRNALDGIVLTLRSNFAWITGGRDNHIANYVPAGVASILVTRDGRRVCLTNTIEAPRFRQEELVGTGIETIDFPWWDEQARRDTLRDVFAGRKIASDDGHYGMDLPWAPPGWDELRWSLTDAEITRYREGGRLASDAMEAACRALRPGMSEHEVAGILDHHVHAAGLNPVVTLVAADERIEKFRHPIPTPARIRRRVMLVTCAQHGGLIPCLTRFVAFTAPTDDQRSRQQAICNIDAAVNLATRPGRTLGEIFAGLQRAYADNGHDGQWKYHHQGGSTGYNGRDVVATPSTAVRVVENQAFAWNPSIVGAKSEDTVLVSTSGVQVLTAPSENWPTLQGQAGKQTLRRADVLVM